MHALRYGEDKLLNEARYEHDSLGRRTHKQVEIEGTLTTTQFLWQGLRLLQETCGGRQQLYIYEPDSYAPLARVDRTEAGKPSLYYLHTDQIGTPLEVTSAQGDLVWQARYKAWGEVERFEVQSIEQPLRFQGQYFDAETGLHYNTFRYYDPGVGRFTTQDPIGLLGGDNLYQYAVNPTGWVDPLGLAGNDILFDSEFWKTVQGSVRKTTMRVKGASVFEITQKVNLDGIKKGDFFHLDTLHLNEIEVYDSKKSHKAVFHLNGNKSGNSIKGRSCG